MSKRPEPWWREDREAWFVQIDRKRYNLGRNKKKAWQTFHALMANPPKRTVMASDSLSAIIEAFLEWSEHHRSPVTYEWYRCRLKHFFNAYPDLRIGELRPYHVQEWIDRMPVASGTKRNYCRAVKRCVRWAKKQGHIDLNPIADLEVPRGGKREKVVTVGEWEAILAAVTDRSFRDLLIITWETGCRPQESLRVESRHVDLVNQRWVFPESESKTDIPRVVYLTDEALAISKRLMLQHPSGPLFRNSTGDPQHEGLLRTRSRLHTAIPLRFRGTHAILWLPEGDGMLCDGRCRKISGNWASRESRRQEGTTLSQWHVLLEDEGSPCRRILPRQGERRGAICGKGGHLAQPPGRRIRGAGGPVRSRDASLVQGWHNPPTEYR